ncbi:MAG: hypothetical protein K2F87_04635 [Muribaculaceae bacterium]|nr:hypothetical protein [Muribaculaceae bacterium]
MDKNLVIQYTVVAILILFALGSIIRNIRRRNKRKGSAGTCMGCSLADSCKNKKRRVES